LLAAAQRLQATDEIRFLIVGGGSGLEALRVAARERGLSNLLFAAYQSEATLADTLAAADVHLVCLRPELEGLVVPSKLYGILAAGRPALFWGDPDGEVARELRRTAAGLSVAAGDGAALAAAIEGLRTDPAQCAAMSRAARAAYLERYTRELAAARWLEVLGPVAGDRDFASRSAKARPGTCWLSRRRILRRRPRARPPARGGGIPSHGSATPAILADSADRGAAPHGGVNAIRRSDDATARATNATHVPTPV